MKKIVLPFLVCSFLVATNATAQDNLVKVTSATKVDKSKKAFKFTNLIDLSTTPVQNQGSSGTCWSYSTNSFVESEMIKAGKDPIHLSKIFTARKQYEDKAEVYVKMGGNIGWGDGGEAHDVLAALDKYGALPESEYTGLIDGATRNNFADMQSVIENMLKGYVNNKSGAVNQSYKKLVSSTLDAFLGEVPKEFTYKGKKYTPKTFGEQVVGIKSSDYIEFLSQTNTPYYQKAYMMVPDNWSGEWVWNVPMTDFTYIIDNALKNGYTISWGADVSEPYFSWPNGVAYVPETALSLDAKRMKKEEKDALFTSVHKELKVTPEMRQAGLDNLTTTDDHGMHIVGLAKDQNGTEYYIVKNSWGADNDYKGFLYVSKTYVQFKTTSVLVNKKGVPTDVMNKLSVEKL